jgi:DNA-binding transcriptional LysR family regulator
MGWIFHGATFAHLKRNHEIDKPDSSIDFFNEGSDPVAMLNVHHLELFYYVARAGGITAALRTIPYGIQQPAVSAQLAMLEDAVGLRLFERRPFSLTEAGRVVLDHISPFFSGLPKLEARLHSEAVTHLRLAASAIVLRDHLPDLLMDLLRKIPGLRLTLREGGQEAIERMLRESEIDLGVLSLERKVAPGLRCETLLRVPMVLLVLESSPWQRAADLFRAVKGDSPTLIALPPQTQVATLFHQELARRGVDWPASLEAGTLDLIETYVARGFGVGLGMDTPSRSPIPGVRRLALKGFPTVEFAALWREPLPLPAQGILELVRERARTLKGRSVPD